MAAISVSTENTTRLVNISSVAPVRGYDSTLLEAVALEALAANLTVIKNNEDSASNMKLVNLSNGLLPTITYSKTDGVPIGSGGAGTYWITG
jgi:hypothetical protein